ncbi:hypothetical protein FVB9532_03323 [Mesonia oceanica]|uniref:Uncharacterized protein n=1 Tax=Mesonia oceanica TaxID=2687242 RepID=A0AC61YCB5_9FLAO|nr:hypothetical protein FVB9532_03323 [Mesonia oceanica]|tara:strand:+ start:9902 stop:10078 length:177 start_codon:yes stop_codon:yes gene_type:complete
MLAEKDKACIFASASPTQPAPVEFPQGGNAARVDGRSGVMWVACHFLFPLFKYFPFNF